MIQSFKKLLTSVDILNTINGGISEPFLSLREQNMGREIKARVPGLTSESLHMEIANNTLTIFYIIPINVHGELLQVPHIIYNQTIPYFVNTAKIDVLQNENELIVHLPFNELRDGSTHRIELDHD
jgi:hypothetical protein